MAGCGRSGLSLVVWRRRRSVEDDRAGCKSHKSDPVKDTSFDVSRRAAEALADGGGPITSV